MKRSDFIPDDRLKLLLQFVQDAPDAIKLAADNAWDCNRVEIDNVEQRINDIKAETEWDVKTEEVGVPKFPTEAKRKAEYKKQVKALDVDPGTGWIEATRKDIEASVVNTLKFTNEGDRKKELNNRLIANTDYQNRLEEKHRLETERNQKFTIMYEAKNTFKSVCKQLDMAVVLQDSENLVHEITIMENRLKFIKETQHVEKT